MRKLNWLFFMGLIAGTAVLGLGAYFLHDFQVRRNASALLERARSFQGAGELSKATGALRQYLSLNDQDHESWRWFSKSMDESSVGDRRQRLQALLVHQEAMRRLPDDADLALRSARIAMELGGRHLTEASEILRSLLQSATQPDPADEAELHELYGECLERMGKFEGADGAAGQFQQGLKLDGKRVSLYRMLAALQRTRLRQDEAADETILNMINKNPNSGLAYLYKFEYDNRFRPPAREGDLRKALELSPDDPQVLLDAAADSQRRNKLGEARDYLQKGLKLDPKDPGFSWSMAEVAMQEGKADEAEALLRDAYERRPSAEIAYGLARFLVAQKKIQGEDGADHYLQVLRARGMGESLGREIQARIKIQQQDWSGALVDIDAAQAAFRGANAVKLTELERMRAACLRSLGLEEQHLAALEKTVDAGIDDAGSRVELAYALARTSNPVDLDRALKMFQVLAPQRPEVEIDIAKLLIGKARRGQLAGGWTAVERQVQKAESTLQDRAKYPRAEEAITMLRSESLLAQNKPEQARELLAAAVARAPDKVTYRLALARLTSRDESGKQEALKILDQARRDLGARPEITLARLSYWGTVGGDQAKAEVAKLSETLKTLPEAERPTFLERLSVAEETLGERELARQHLRELARLQPKNIQVILRLFDLALDAGDEGQVNHLIDDLFALENPGADKSTRRDRNAKGTNWRYAQAAYLLNRESKRKPGENPREGDPGSVELIRIRELADEILALRPFWWGGPLIQSRLVELDNPDTPEGRAKKIDAYRKVFDLGYTNPTTVLRMLGLLEAEGRTQEIDEVIAKLRARDDVSSELKLVGAVNAWTKKDTDQALRLTKEISDSSSRYTDHLSLARIYLANGRADEANGEFRRAVSLAPGAPAVWEQYVEFLAQTSRLDEARAAIEGARKSLPADRAALSLARCLLMIGDQPQAEQFLRAALKSRPGDPATLQFAALFYYAVNRATEVTKYLDELTGPETAASPEDMAWANRLRAMLLVRSGQQADLEAAVRLVDKNLLSFKESVADKRLKAKFLALLQKKAEAIGLLTEKGMQLSQDDRFLLAQLYLSRNDSKSYEDQMSRLLQAAKVSNPQHLAHFSSYLLQSNHLNEAERFISRLSQGNPQSPATLELEVRLRKAKQGGQSTAQLRDFLVERGKQSPDLIGSVAAELARNGFPADAEAAYKEFIARNPGEPERELALVNFLSTQAGRVAEAMERLSKASDRCKLEQVAIAALSVYDSPSVTEAQRKQIEAWVSEASRKRPDLVLLSNKLAAIWIRQGRFDEAEGLYRRLLQSNPANPEALNNLAWLLALRDRKNTGEAVELVDRAIQLQGRTASLSDTRAVALIRAGKVAEAIEELKEAQKSDPRNYNVPLHLAWANQNAGNIDDARKAFQKAIELGWKADRSDPLERTHIAKLRVDLGL